MGIFEYILSLIAPHHCVGCGIEGSLLCVACAKALPPIPSRCYRCLRPTDAFRVCVVCRTQSALTCLFAVTAYDAHAKALLHKLKFERGHAAARDIARCMAGRLTVDTTWTVTSVPTAPNRVRQRGYDQAALVARQLAGMLNLPYRPLLARSGTQRQLGQGRNIRLQQMRQVFYVSRPAAAHNVCVLLVDDVVTTGATCEAAAAALIGAGAKRVDAATFAAA